MIELRALGAVDLRRRDGPELLSVLSQPKRTALLAYLLLARPRGSQRRDRLLALFWPEADSEHGRNSLRQAVHFLRRSLGEEVVESRSEEELGVARGEAWCDALAFEEALERGDAETALTLYGGELLPGFFVEGAPEFEHWLDAERARLRGRAVRAAYQLADARERSGDAAGALELGARALALAPDDDALLRAHMERLERLGDRAGALAAFESFSRRLVAEYELQPEAETRALAERIRTASNFTPAPVASAAALNPATPTPPATHLPPEATSSPTAPPPRLPTNVQPTAVTQAARWRRQRWVGAAAALFVLAALGGWWVARERAPAVDPRRVIVVPFENATGDSALAALGPMIADVVTQAVATSGFAEAVPPPPVPIPSAEGPFARPVEQLARAARAGIVFTGRYYLVGDSVEVEAHAVALDRRDREIGVRPIRGPRARPDSVAEAARDRLLGVLAAQIDRPAGFATLASLGVRPPTYAAYREYRAAWLALQAGTSTDAAPYLRKALELDTTFYAAAVMLGWVTWYAGQTAESESLTVKVAPHRAELEPESRIDLEIGLAYVDGGWGRAYRLIRDLPGRTWFSSHDLAIAALALRRPHDALRWLEITPPREYYIGTERWGGFHMWKTHALFVLGDHEAELRAARRALELFPDQPRMTFFEGRALAALGRTAEARTRAEALLAKAPPYAGMGLDLADLIALRDNAAARALYGRALATIDPGDTSYVAVVRRARLLLALGRIAEARAAAETAHARRPTDRVALQYLGLAAAQAGDRAAADSVEREITALPGYPVLRARHTMTRAMIAATLGDRERAVQLVADAYAGGHPYEPPLLYAPGFANVRGYPPFDALMRPLD